jgi:hypothetical protein
MVGNKAKAQQCLEEIQKNYYEKNYFSSEEIEKINTA